MPNLTKTGRYELLEELGRGAMGVVYRAHDPVIGRDVAVKTMHLSADGSGVTRPDFISRFQTEARAAGILTHPNIVVVYDAGEEAGIFYITMELVEGRSLQAMLDAKQTFPIPRALRIIEQACSALDYAHRHNIVHRDVKPANLMITGEDIVKITDFGTAKILRFNTTQTAQVIGTPSYMSPEQIKGKSVDGRADIFALGVILYELATGEKPFPGQNITTVVYKIVSEEPISPRQLAPSIHPGLAAIIMRALAKDPVTRFQTCAEMLEALKNYRNFPHELREDLHAAYLPPPTPARTATLGMQPLAVNPIQSIAMPSISAPQGARLSSPTMRGHTLYDPAVHKEPRSWSAFWFCLLLLGMIGASGYYVWPYTHDVWAVVHNWYEGDKAVKPSATPAPVKSAPATRTPGRKAANPTPSTVALTPNQQDLRAGTTPTQKTNASNTASATGTDNAEDTNTTGSSVSTAVPVVQPLQKQTSKPPIAASQPPADSEFASNPTAPLNMRLETLKNRIEQRITNAGLGNRVQVTVAGGGLLLQGRLRVAEHRALLNRLRTLPDWVHVTDDIAYDDTPGQTAPGKSPSL